jgi:hypothetical protein
VQVLACLKRSDLQRMQVSGAPRHCGQVSWNLLVGSNGNTTRCTNEVRLADLGCVDGVRLPRHHKAAEGPPAGTLADAATREPRCKVSR